jgi:uncharacterized protein (DUF697 family)
MPDVVLQGPLDLQRLLLLETLYGAMIAERAAQELVAALIDSMEPSA